MDTLRKLLKPKVREKHYNNILKDNISNTHKKIKKLNKDLESNEKYLGLNTKWIKFILIKYFEHCLVSKENKKFTNLYVETQIKDVTVDISQKHITNCLNMNYYQKKF